MTSRPRRRPAELVAVAVSPPSLPAPPNLPPIPTSRMTLLHDRIAFTRNREESHPPRTQPPESRFSRPVRAQGRRLLIAVFRVTSHARLLARVFRSIAPDEMRPHDRGFASGVGGKLLQVTVTLLCSDLYVQGHRFSIQKTTTVPDDHHVLNADFKPAGCASIRM